MIRNKFVLILIIFAFLPLEYVEAQEENTAVIASEKAKLYQKPRIFSKTVSNLKYNDRVKILKSRKSWYFVSAYVKTRWQKGWLRKTSIEKRPQRVAEIGKGESISSSYGDKDAATAGKGFNPDIESEYRGKNPKIELGYKRLEKVERNSVSFSEFTEPDFVQFTNRRKLRSSLVSGRQARN